MPCRPNNKCCFHCMEWFDITVWTFAVSPMLCEKCNQYKCPWCHSCFCNVSKKVKNAVIAMEKTYEKYLEEKGI